MSRADPLPCCPAPPPPLNPHLFHRTLIYIVPNYQNYHQSLYSPQAPPKYESFHLQYRYLLNCPNQPNHPNSRSLLPPQSMTPPPASPYYLCPPPYSHTPISTICSRVSRRAPDYVLRLPGYLFIKSAESSLGAACVHLLGSGRSSHGFGCCRNH